MRLQPPKGEEVGCHRCDRRGGPPGIPGRRHDPGQEGKLGREINKRQVHSVVRIADPGLPRLHDRIVGCVVGKRIADAGGEKVESGGRAGHADVHGNVRVFDRVHRGMAADDWLCDDE